MSDARHDALSLTLPKLGSRSKAKRRKLPKPPKRDLALLILWVFNATSALLRHHWVVLGVALVILGVYWIELLSSMRLRRPPWWRRGLVEVITFSLVMIALALVALIFA